MNKETFFYRFSITKDELTKLFLLLGTASLESIEGDTFSLNGVKNHKKHGFPGVEDGTNHYFDTTVCYLGMFGDGKVSLNSRDNGETYQGGVKFEVEARTDFDSIQSDVKKLMIGSPRLMHTKFSGQDPAAWIANQDRLIRSALKRGDKQQLADYQKEVAEVVGQARAQWWILEIKEKMESEKNGR